MKDAAAFQACRPRLLAIAYGMLGERAEAEDVVQDAWLRFDAATGVRDAEPFLVTTTTRLAIDRLRSARMRREAYVGPWLPEPLLADPQTPESVVLEAEQLSQALLFALERLNPAERAVLLLRDVLDLDYAEIAHAVDKTPEAVRQIAVRARRHAGDARRRATVDRSELERVGQAFLLAVWTGDTDGVRDLLAADAVLWSDGGGVVQAARKPVFGVHKIANFLLTTTAKYAQDADVELLLVNGSPGVRVTRDGAFVTLMSLEVEDGQVTTLWALRNPERFGGLPVRR